MWEGTLKIIACADLHITNKCPKSRNDNYYSEVLRKFSEILKHSYQKTLIVAGDFFDKHNVSNEVIRDVVDILRGHLGRVLVVPGQHDLRYHSKGLKNTPLGILEATKFIEILSSKEIKIVNGVSYIGSGWGESPDKDENCEIMVTHQMVTLDGPLFPGHEDYTTAAQLLNKYPGIDIIISGDNHKPHVYVNDNNQLQINCGSMMRKSKDQMDFKPRIYEIDTDKLSVEPIFLTVNKDVFDLDAIEREEEKEIVQEKANENIQKFLKTLDVSDSEKPNFANMLKKVIEVSKPKKEVTEIINNIMEKIND